MALLKLNSVSTDDGTVLVYDGDVLEVGYEVYIDGDEGLTPAPDKDYVVGENIVTVEGGKVTTIVARPVEEKPEDEVPEETETETETEPEEKPEEEEKPTEEEVPEDEVPEETEPTVDELKAVIDEQKTLIEELRKENEELKRQLEEPAAEPAEEQFKKQEPEEKHKIDFSKYIKRKIN